MRLQRVTRATGECDANPVGVSVPEHGTHGREVRELGAEDRRGRAALLCLWRRLGGPRLEQAGIVGEDRLLQALELRSRLKPQLGVQGPDRVAVRIERLALTSRAIQGEHQLSTQPLAQRLGGHQLLELGHELGAAAEHELGLDTILDGGGPQVLQPRDLGRCERLERHVGQRRPPPFLERGTQARRGALGPVGGERPPALLAQPLEPRQVELVALDAHAVAGSAGHEPPGLAAERAAQPRDHGLDGLVRPVGRPLTPQVRDHALARDRLPGTQEQHREQRTLPRSRDRQGSTFQTSLDRSEHAEIHAFKLPADARERQPLSPRRK